MDSEPKVIYTEMRAADATFWSLVGFVVIATVIAALSSFADGKAAGKKKDDEHPRSD